MSNIEINSGGSCDSATDNPPEVEPTGLSGTDLQPDNGFNSPSFKAKGIDLFKDDGTLELLRISCLHPTLKRCFEDLTNKSIPCFNELITKYRELGCGSWDSFDLPSSFKRQLFELTDNLNNGILTLDCIDLYNLNPLWGMKDSIRQSRKELVQLIEHLVGNLDELAINFDMLEQSNSESLTSHDNKTPEKPGWADAGTQPRDSSKFPKLIKIPRNVENEENNNTLSSKSVSLNCSSVIGDVDPAVSTRLYDQSHCSDDHKATEAKISNRWDKNLAIKKQRISEIALKYIENQLGDNSSDNCKTQSKCGAECVTRFEREFEAKNEAESSEESGNSLDIASENKREKEEGNDVDGEVGSTEKKNETKNWDAGQHPSETARDNETLHKKRNRSKKSIDWNTKLRETIDLYKTHTSMGGCITTLYEYPVNRETLLALLEKCLPQLEGGSPTSPQIKVAIETFIAGLETAYNYLLQLRVNKAQMQLLYRSASVLTDLNDPADLIPEIKSLQGLLKTFGMF